MRDVLEIWIQLHSHPEIEISFKFIPNVLMSKVCIHFIGPLCMYTCAELRMVGKIYRRNIFGFFVDDFLCGRIIFSKRCNP